ncbi:MAG: hypothetical protein M3417_13095 [Actinomycetota bacterium]|nr:hypothetical protein [Actinomycetota bacterium]
MPVSRAVTARGALAGAVAATVWALQQPLDRRVFGVPYDDCELLGKAVTRGRWALPLGWALHAANGALLGAVYAHVAPRVALPSWARGPAAGMAEHAATWPATALVPALHPAGADFPKLWGSGPALAQATWRHGLFGVVLGELERRLNAEPEPEIPAYEAVVSPNGHGTLEHATVVGLVEDDA